MSTHNRTQIVNAFLRRVEDAVEDTYHERWNHGLLPDHHEWRPIRENAITEAGLAKFYADAIRVAKHLSFYDSPNGGRAALASFNRKYGGFDKIEEMFR